MMKKPGLLLVMLCVMLLSAAQSQQPKGASRRHVTTQRSQKSQKSQNSKKPQRPQPSQKQQLQAQRRQLKKSIASNKRHSAELEQRVKKQLEDALILGTEIGEQMRVIDTLRLGLDSLDRQIADFGLQLEKLGGELRERQKRYANSVRYMHRNRRMQSKMMFILSAKNINQMYRRTRFMNEYSTYQKAQGEAVRQKQAQVEQKREELEKAKQEQAGMLARQEREKRVLESQQEQKRQMAKELQKQQRTVTALIDRQQKEEAEIDAQIERLVAEEIAREQARLEAERIRKAEEQARLERERSERQRAAAEKAKEKERKQEQKKEKRQNKAIEKQVRRQTRELARRSSKRSERPQTSQENSSRRGSEVSTRSRQTFASADPDAHLTGSFASNKGRLPMPITGAYQMVRGFGENVVDGTRGVHLSSKGIYLKGQPGAQARCVFDGEVSKIFSTGSSYIVMVRHGRFISVYSDLASVSVTAGQKVSTSQTLGRLGPTNTMQFQLRNWTELLNPRNWLRR